MDEKVYKKIFVPTLIEDLKDYVVDRIMAGHNHSYCRTSCGKHFLFGSNENNECITFDDRNKVKKPHRIDEIVKEKCNVQSIVDVISGRYNTKLICMQ